MHHLLGHSITYRIAVGPQQGRKVLTLQTLPDCGSDDPCARTPGNVAGFSLHAGVATKANERDKLERLCRYIARSAVSTQRLSLTRNGQVRYELKTPYANGTTHVVFEPLGFIARLVALVPRPRVNLTRYHGVFAPPQPVSGAANAGDWAPQKVRMWRSSNARRAPGIHDLGTATETRVQYRYRNLQRMRW